MVESENVERVLIAIFKLCLRKITIKILLVTIRQIDNDLQFQLCQALTGMLIFFFLFGSDRSPIMCALNFTYTRNLKAISIRHPHFSPDEIVHQSIFS